MVLMEKDILVLQFDFPIIALQMAMVVVRETSGQEVCPGAVVMVVQVEQEEVMEQTVKMEAIFQYMVEEVMEEG